MLKELREEKGLTQNELSYLTKISIKTISRIENNDINVNLQTVKKLANFFNVYIDEIIEIKKR